MTEILTKTFLCKIFHKGPTNVPSGVIENISTHVTRYDWRTNESSIMKQMIKGRRNIAHTLS